MNLREKPKIVNWRLGFPVTLSVGIGVILTACTIVSTEAIRK